jgi:hypothetical protein
MGDDVHGMAERERRGERDGGTLECLVYIRTCLPTATRPLGAVNVDVNR